MFELLVRSRKFVFGMGVMLAIILFGVVGSMIVGDPLQPHPYNAAEPPSSTFLLGTGDLGEDMLAQL